MEEQEKISALFKHADQLIQVAFDVFEQVNLIPVSDEGASDPKAIAIALLCRTISNLKGIIILLQNRRIVEARILARSAYENVLYIVALREEGHSFVKKMGYSDFSHKKSRGQSLLAFSHKNGTQHQSTGLEPLKKFLKGLKNKQIPSVSLTPKEISKYKTAEYAHILYEQLSADSGHPTTDALGRYISKIEENGKIISCIDIDPIIHDEEITQTLFFGCNAMLGVLVGANEILGGTAANDKVKEVFDLHQSIVTP